MKNTITLIILGFLFVTVFVDGYNKKTPSEEIYLKNDTGKIATKPIFSPKTPKKSFSAIKKIARDKIYNGKQETFYCGCSYEPTGNSGGGVIDKASCGSKKRKSETRASRVEWEHVIPAYMFGHNLPCWNIGHPECNKKGRACCHKVNKGFRTAELDLHNLVPSVGELNGDRSNYPYGIIEGEVRNYGACDFEVDFENRVAEPTEGVRGDVARIWLYMTHLYNTPVSEEQKQQFILWNKADPTSEWECIRDKRIQAEQGNTNPYLECR